MDFTPHTRLTTCTNTWRNDVEDKSFGGEALEIETHKWMDNHHPFSVLLMPRSLLIFKDNAYSGGCLVLVANEAAWLPFTFNIMYIFASF